MNARFYAPAANGPGGIVALPDEEAQHLTRVLRLKTGSVVRVFDGRGHEFDAVVHKAGKNEVLVAVGASRDPAAREPRVAVTLAQAVLKGDKMDDIVRDAVMMGVTAIQPLVSTRTEVALSTLQRGNRHERWRRIAVSSAKQCGRATVPAILAPRTFDAVAGALGDMTLPGPGLMLVEPGVSDDVVSLSDLNGDAPRETTVLIGPEGGWTREEVQLAARACRLITLRAPTLRADAMSLVALTALLTHWHQL
jgi:16S rRNA (uracil1498-N3)-methyltransferase